jgi:hypothetical protein
VAQKLEEAYAEGAPKNCQSLIFVRRAVFTRVWSAAACRRLLPPWLGAGCKGLLGGRR